MLKDCRKQNAKKEKNGGGGIETVIYNLKKYLSQKMVLTFKTQRNDQDEVKTKRTFKLANEKLRFQC